MSPSSVGPEVVQDLEQKAAVVFPPQNRSVGDILKRGILKIQPALGRPLHFSGGC